MDAASKLLNIADKFERVVIILSTCRTADEVRAGFLKTIDELESGEPVPKVQNVVLSLKAAAQAGMLNDDQVIPIRDQILFKFPNDARTFRETAQRMRAKRWWQFWR